VPSFKREPRGDASEARVKWSQATTYSESSYTAPVDKWRTVRPSVYIRNLAKKEKT